MFRLPNRLRDRLRKPFGTLYRDLAEVLPLLSGKAVYTVGDVVTHRLLRLGITPDIAIIDGMSMRSPCVKRPKIKARCLRARNPAGAITAELISAIEDALAHTPAIVMVEGEEDLAVIPLVLAAPEGGVVLYGQPNEGVVMRLIDSVAKAEAQSLFTEFDRE